MPLTRTHTKHLRLGRALPSKAGVLYVCGLAFALLFTLFFIQPVSAATTCDVYNASLSVPTGYGASYNVFNTAQMMVSIACNEDQSITVTSGNNDPLTYIYNQGYRYDAGTGNWVNFTYSCSNLIADAWCVGQVSKTLTNLPTADVSFLVSYTCQWSGTKWNCGCSNSSCSTHSWQLQGWETGTAIPTGDAKYLSFDFENADWDTKVAVWNAENVYRETGAAAYSGSYGIRMHVPQGEHWGGELHFEHSKYGQPKNLNEIWSRFYIKFAENWWRDDYRIGKAGYRTRSDEVCRAPCLEMTDSGHSTEAGVVGLPEGQSYFHKNVSEQDLVDGTFSHRGVDWIDGSERQRGQWYCVETHIKLNTPGVGNGVYQNWLDGVQVSDVTQANFRDSDIFNLDRSSLITFIGGDWTADHDMDVYYDDWAVSDQRIGCE